MLIAKLVHSVEWPGKEHQTSKPKGYAYVIFESEKQIRALLGSCTVQEANAATARKYFYKISGKCLKTQKVRLRELAARNVLVSVDWCLMIFAQNPYRSK